MSVPLFSIDDSGHAKPFGCGNPDGKTRLSAEQASAITGEPAGALQRNWASIFKDLLSDELPNEDQSSPIGLTLDPAKVADVRLNLEEILRDQHFKTLPVEDIAYVRTYAEKRGFDVWSGHVWAERRLNETTKTMELVVGVCLDGLRARAVATGLFAGMDEPVVTYDEHKQLIKAATTVYRRTRKGSKNRDGFTGVAYFNNYYPGKGFWDGREEMMLMKCSKAVGLRDAFPDLLGKLYDREEMVRTFSNPSRRQRGPRAPTISAEPESDVPLDRMQFTLALLSEFGVKDEQTRDGIIQQLRNQFPHLANSGDPAAFYPRAWRAVLLQPKLFGLQPRQEPPASAAAGQ